VRELLAAGLPAPVRDALARVPGAQVHAVRTGEELASALASRAWDLAVVHGSLPGEPFARVLRRVRSSAPSARTPVLFLEFSDMPTVSPDARDAAGIAAVLHPDATAEDVARAAEALLGRPAPLPAPPPREVMAAAMAGVWERFRGTIFGRVQTLEAAALALLEGTLTEEERRKAEREAHKLAGSVGTFGFAEGSAVARRLEHLFAGAAGARTADAPQAGDLVMALRRELERAPQPPVAVPETASAAVAGPSGRPVLLVADADPEVADRVAVEAGGRGFDVRTAGDLETARALARGTALAVALVDTALRDDDGVLELVAELSAREPRVPVLVLSARSSFADRVDAARRGAAAFLSKPTPPRAVLDSVERVLHRASDAGSSVMAVDDDPRVLDAMAAVLAPTGALLHTLEEPLEFWDALERWCPDVLVLDVDMPHLNGIELCRVVRNDPRWTSLPVLFLTSRTDAPTVAELYAAGADDYVQKPIVGPELVTRIHNRLERARLHRSLADTDGLTGVANRRRCEESVAQLLRLATRQQHPFSLAVLDLDHFKQVNDRAGHATGDEVIRALARHLTRGLRAEDVVSRWGGEEFVVGMYATEKDDAVRRLDRALEGFRRVDFSEAGEEPLNVSFSGGVAQFPQDGADLNALYRAADAALYLAKENGRDRVLPVGWREDSPDAADRVDVLVVDDDEALSPLLVHALQTRGYRTRWLADGQKAAEMLLGPRPALRARVVLLDVDLPGLDGVGLLRAMARERLLGRTRVVMLTVRSVEEEVVLAMEEGAFDHVAKPFSIPVLLQRVRRALRA
jgi:diguanylate cyclase (GGDEF)-like protein